jgi:hypothetical protein
MGTRRMRRLPCPRSFCVGGTLLLATALSWCLYPARSEAAAQPAFTSAPAIAGAVQVGQTLTESHANWTFGPIWFAYQWQDCDAGGQHCNPITGASARTYVVGASDLGHTLRVEETAVGWSARGQATSAATTAVSAPSVTTAPPPVGRVSSATTIMTLESSAVTDQIVTLIATVTSSSAASRPSGTLAFESHGAPIPGCQSEPIQPTGQSVTVSCQTSFAASVAQLTAVFTPAAGSVVGGSASAADSFTVGPSPTTTAVAVSRRAVHAHKSTTYTATLRPGYLGPVLPSQSVTFLDNGQTVPACAGLPLAWNAAAGVATATCTVSYTRSGQHLITATYGGDANFTSSTSSPAELVDTVAGRIHPVLSWSFYYAPRYSRVLVLTVNHLPHGARVQVTCAGRGCPLASRAVSVHHSSRAAGGANLARLFGRHRMRPGTVISVTVERPGYIGKRYSFLVRAAHAPRVRITCQAPGLAPGVGC